MQFIHFIDSNLQEKVLKEGIPLHPNQRKRNPESTGIFCYPLLRIPFKSPYLKKDLEDYLDYEKKAQQLNESLSIEEAWAVIGASRVQKRQDKVEHTKGIIIELNPAHWPITVFINIHHSIGLPLAQLLEQQPNKDIVYGLAGHTLLDIVQRIDSPKYVIASAPFIIPTENDLLDFIDIFQQAGGGLWQEDSFECMVTEVIPSENIVR